MTVLEDKLLSIGEAAHYLGVSIDTLRNWDKQGKLPSQKTQKGTRKYSFSSLEKVKHERSASKNPVTPEIKPQNQELAGSREYLLIGDAARYLGVSIDTLRNWEKQNKIVSTRTPGGQRKYLRSELDKAKQTSSYLINKTSKPFIAEELLETLIPSEPSIRKLNLDLRHLSLPEKSETVLTGNQLEEYIKPEINVAKTIVFNLPKPVILISGMIPLFILFFVALFSLTPLKQYALKGY